MSDTKDTTHTPPAPAAEDFDLQAFWIQHGKNATRVVIAIIILLGAWGYYQWNQTKKATDSAKAFAAAKTADDFRKVATEWAGTPASALARLQLAAALRDEGKYDDAIAELRKFTSENPKHELSVGALNSLGLTFESAGKLDDALSTFQQVSTSHKTSPYAEPALIAQARILKTKDKPEDAMKILTALSQDYPGSMWMFEAMRLRRDLTQIITEKTPPPSAETPAISVEAAPAPSTPPPVPVTPEAAPAPTPAPEATPAATPANSKAPEPAAAPKETKSKKTKPEGDAKPQKKDKK